MKKILFSIIIISFLGCTSKNAKKSISNDSFSSSNNSSSSSNDSIVISDKPIITSEINIDLNEELTYKDLFKLKEYEMLSKDEDYKDYINDLWKANISFNKKIFALNELKGAEVNLNGKTKDDPIAQKEALLTIAKTTGKLISKGLKMSGDGIKIIKLESKQKDLYASFSSEKKKLAIAFEKKINSTIDFSCNFPINQNVKKKDLYQNYKSIGKTLIDDDDIMNYLKPLIKDVDKFFISSIDIKSLLKLNKSLNPEKDYSQIVDYGNKIIDSNGETDVKINSSILSDYYKPLIDIMKILKTQNFKIPVEDWSKEKQKNFNFIIDDIKIKLKNDINSLNG